jgi:transketolase
VYEAQKKSYRDAVLPPDVTARVAVEAGSSAAWYKYVGSSGRVIGIDRFGKSAPANALFEYFEITAEKTAESLSEILSEAENATDKSPSWPVCQGQRSG